ncbi:hypothetical protein CBL_03155 [Carabus blaptoides fortunei]
MSKRKAPDTDNNQNNDFCEFLTELANYERNTNRNIHKYNAYRKAASVLANQSKRIKTGDEARKLPGIGDKISKKIDEFLQTGKLQKLENIRQDDQSIAINLFTRISGIGPAKAKELVDSGITTIDELKQHISKLTHHQQIGLKYMEDFEKRIPRSEIEETETLLKAELAKLDKEYLITICGSYRRGKSESGDIDVLLTHPSYTSTCTDKKLKSKLFKDVIIALEACKFITETISVGETKFMGACKLNGPTRRLDIRFTPSDQFYCSILYFTGSDMFNKAMRAHALEQKFTLNEYSLRPIGSTGIAGEPVPIASEEEIFEYIDFPYKKPEERNM